MLAALRESVRAESTTQDNEAAQLKAQIASLKDQSVMQVSQINTLLFEKIDMQADGIQQRERMLTKESDLGWVIRLIPGYVNC